MGRTGRCLGYLEVSERTRQRVDDEMRRIVREVHEDAVQLLSEYRHRLDGLAGALFQAETLDGPEAYAAAGLEPPGDYATQAPAPAEVGPRAGPSVSIPRRAHT
jgi:hypothetical protein